MGLETLTEQKGWLIPAGNVRFPAGETSLPTRTILFVGVAIKVTVTCSPLSHMGDLQKVTVTLSTLRLADGSGLFGISRKDFSLHEWETCGQCSAGSALIRVLR